MKCENCIQSDWRMKKFGENFGIDDDDGLDFLGG